MNQCTGFWKKDLKSRKFVIIGDSEVTYLLVELGRSGYLKGRIIAAQIPSDSDPGIVAFENVPAFLEMVGEDASSFTALYAGGDVEDSDLVILREKCLEIYSVCLAYEDTQKADRAGIEHISYTQFVKVRRGLYYPVIKRIGDIVVSGLGILISSPIMLIVALLVRIKLGTPVTFSQARPGRHEKVFFVHKFRSMSNAMDSEGNLLPDDQRLTRFGKILRSTSLDELPQLFSIFTGKMSLIGPRPQSFENVYFMTARQRLRHIVTPGLTGWSQVNGRNAIPWDEKIQYDLDYVSRKITFGLDLRIFFRTIAMVLLRKDITQEGSVSTESVGEFLVRTGKISRAEYLSGCDSSRFLQQKFQA